MGYIRLLLIFTCFFLGCKNGDVAININDNGKTMHLKVSAGNAKKPIDYERIFDVKDMDSSQKKELTNHILDSLGLTTLK